MNDAKTLELKLKINELVWDYAPNYLKLEKAEEISCEILTMILSGKNSSEWEERNKEVEG